MKNAIVTILFFAIGLSLSGQENTPLTKEEKKSLRRQEKVQREKVLAVNTSKAISEGYFVLKANTVSGRAGTRLNVDPLINFISIQGKEAYVQLGNESGLGYNGVGGITLKGNITEYSVRRNEKNGSYSIMINTIGASASLTISMHVSTTGELATANVRTNWGSSVDFTGDLYPVSKTRVFKGTETY